MESFDFPETPESWESAKAGQREAAEEVKNLLDDFERFDCDEGLWMAFREAVRNFLTATAAVDMANRGIVQGAEE